MPLKTKSISVEHPPIRAVTMNLFPTFETLDEAKAYGEAQLPLEHRNEVYSVLMAYQNTLLNVLNKN